MAEPKYDFGGWATRYNLLCSDGRTIRPGAFADCDGKIVPIVWGHDHSGTKSILGNALLQHTDEGVYIHGSFNNTEDGQRAKEETAHGDIRYLSIFATKLKEQAGNVFKGTIKEVSLVPFGGANPGAFIDNAVIAHADGTYELSDDEAIIFPGFEYEIELEHADTEKEEEDVAEEKKETKEEEKDLSVQDVLDGMTDDQLKVVAYLMDEAAKKAAGGDKDDDDGEEPEVKHSDEGGKDNMKYNAFESTTSRPGVLSHADQETILAMAKDSRYGTFQNALNQFQEDRYLAHDDEPAVSEETTSGITAEAVGGFDATTLIDGTHTSFTAILPEYKDVRPGAPELVTYDQGWITAVMSRTHKSPISRIRTQQVDIRNAEQLRAKGYVKGERKTPTGNFNLARRTTDPQTIYVKNALHRDDIIDITDFDYVQYLYNIDRMMFNEELATAILLGDGREVSDPDKIAPEHIRPIWTDDDLFTIHYDMTNEAANIQGSNTSGYFGANYVQAEAMVNACLYAREDYRGSGTPDMFIEQHKLNVMLLARDRNGRRIYSSKAELATALNVNNIYTVEKFSNKTRTKGSGQSAKTMVLDAIIVNLTDYSLGATKGGQVTHFTQFDIDFNQQKSLLEGRQSGALTRIYSAIVIEHEQEQEQASQESGNGGS